MPDAEALRALREGLPLDDGTLTRPARGAGARRRARSDGAVELARDRADRGQEPPGAADGRGGRATRSLELVRVRIGAPRARRAGAGRVARARGRRRSAGSWPSAYDSHPSDRRPNDPAVLLLAAARRRRRPRLPTPRSAPRPSASRRPSSAVRRDIHAHPELGNREERTGKLVSRSGCAALGLEVRYPVAKTGVVGILRAAAPARSSRCAPTGRAADRGANDVPYKSQNPGVKHACGHDAHTTIVLGTAEVLAAEGPAARHGRVPVPARRGGAAGGRGGRRATLMLKEGVLDEPKVEAVYGLHVDGTLDSGQVGWTRRADLRVVATASRSRSKGKTSTAPIPTGARPDPGRRGDGAGAADDRLAPDRRPASPTCSRSAASRAATASTSSPTA